MKKNLNNINNKHLIKIGYKWDFAYLKKRMNYQFPGCKYNFEYPTQISAPIKLKWALWGFYFFFSIYESLENDNFEFKSFRTACENQKEDNFNSLTNETEYAKKSTKSIFYIDSIEISCFEDFKKEMEGRYNGNQYREESIIHFKIKFNQWDFILIKNELIPHLIKYE